MPNPWDNDPIVQQGVPSNPLKVQDVQAGIAHTGAETAGIGIKNAVAAATAPADITHTRNEATLSGFSVQAAAKKQADAIKADQARKVASILASDNVLGAIGEAKSHIGPWTTGMTGPISAHIPGTEGYTLGANLDTVGGNIAFDQYKQLKENMPEGAQGGVRLTDNELKLLQNLQGSIRQGLPAPVLSNHLDQIGRQYRVNAAMAAGLDPNDQSVQSQLGISPPPASSMVARTHAAPPQRPGMFGTLGRQQAQAALTQALSVLNQNIARLPKAAQQVGLQHFNADPRIQRLRAAAQASGQDGGGGARFLGFEP